MKTSSLKITVRRNRRQGQALVEMALVLPFLLLLVVGIIEFGRAFYYKQQAINAARETVRLLVVTPTLTNANKDTVAGVSTIKTNFGLSDLKIGSSPSNETTLVNSPAVKGDPIYAKASKAFVTITPNFPPFNQIPSNITGTATMRYEQ